MNVLTLISAKGHNDLIPRKLLRRLMQKPLLQYALDQSRVISKNNGDVIVLTDDEEIELYCQRQGAVTKFYSEQGLPNGAAEAAVVSLIEKQELERQVRYDVILWLSPQSPLLQAEDLRQALMILEKSSAQALYSVSKLEQYHWLYENGSYKPCFLKTENPAHQLLHREISAFFIFHRSCILEGKYQPTSAKPFFIDEEKALEVRTFHDLWVAHQLLRRKRIVFVIAGYAEIGMGHVYRSLQLAHEFLEHEVYFVCDHLSTLAVEKISEYRYPIIQMKKNDNLLETVLSLKPEIVINDFLDTELEYINALKKKSCKVINFEDQGNGAAAADLVINALYKDSTHQNMLTGPAYFDIRHEFLTAPRFQVRKELKTILLTFGGSDQVNLTLRVTKLLSRLLEKGIKLIVISGPGYQNQQIFSTYLENHENRKAIEWIRTGTKKISEYMLQSDLVICSAGRTVYELAALKIPAVIIAANERETTHFFAQESGMIYLGHQDQISDRVLLSTVEELLCYRRRKAIYDKLCTHSITSGINNIVEALDKCINGEKEHVEIGKQVY